MPAGRPKGSKNKPKDPSSTAAASEQQKVKKPNRKKVEKKMIFGKSVVRSEDQEAVNALLDMEAAASTTAEDDDGRPQPWDDIVDVEAELVKYYTTHKNSIGDTWFTCNMCPEQRIKYSSSLRDHINAEHLQVELACTHCDFTTYRFKSLNLHRKKDHGLGGFSCWLGKCGFKTILKPRMLKHLMQKHQFKR